MMETADDRAQRAPARRAQLLPVVMAAAGALLVLKIGHLTLGGDNGSLSVTPAAAQEESAPETGAGPGEEAAADDAAPEPAGDGETGQPAEAGASAAAPAPANPPVQDPRYMTKSEMDVLQRLLERRKEMDRRAQELELREKLLMATEQRVADKIAELREIEARIESRLSVKRERKSKQFRNLVGMYENMKPKDAARIFETLDMDVLLSVAQEMKARSMASVLANMSPKAAQRLTVELAARANGELTSSAAEELPSIDGDNPG